MWPKLHRHEIKNKKARTYFLQMLYDILPTNLTSNYKLHNMVWNTSRRLLLFKFFIYSYLIQYDFEKKKN